MPRELDACLSKRPENDLVCGYMYVPGRGPWYFSLEDFELHAPHAHSRTPTSIVEFVQNQIAEKAKTRREYTREDVKALMMPGIEPRPYQIEAFNKVVGEFNGRGLLGMDMGTGKTKAALPLIKHYGGNVLILTDGGVRSVWVDEALETIGIQIQMLDKSKQKINNQVVVTSYALARVHPEIRSRDWNLIIIDESHQLKNTKTKQLQALMPIFEAVPNLVLLSGTPQSARPADLFAQLHMLYPKAFPCQFEYDKRYCRGHYNSMNRWEARGTDRADELHIVLKSIMFRVIAKDVLLELPKMTRIKMIFSSKGANTRKIDYTKTVAKTKTEIKMTTTLARELEKYDKLSELKYKARLEGSEDAEIRYHNKVQEQDRLLRRLTGNLKMNECLEWLIADIKKTLPQKCLVFPVHLHIVDLISEALTKEGIEHVAVTGKVPSKKRKEILKSMKSVDAEGPKVAILTMQSSGRGLTLIGAAVSYMVEYGDNPDHNLQAECRTYRMGVTHPLTMKYLHMVETYDDRSVDRLVSKDTNNTKVVDGINVGVFKFHVEIDANDGKVLTKEKARQMSVMEMFAASSSLASASLASATTTTTLKRAKA